MGRVLLALALPLGLVVCAVTWWPQQPQGMTRYSAGRVTVFIDDALSATDARQWSQATQQDLTRVETMFGRGFERVPVVYVVSSTERYAWALEHLFKLTPGAAREQAAHSGGVSMLGSVLVDRSRWGAAPDAPIIRHELAHQMVSQLLGGDIGMVPRWLDEGLASLAESYGPDSGQARSARYTVGWMSYTGRSARLARLSSPESWSHSAKERHDYAYAVSAAAAQLLIADVGGLSALVDELEDLHRQIDASWPQAPRLDLTGFASEFDRRAAIFIPDYLAGPRP